MDKIQSSSCSERIESDALEILKLNSQVQQHLDFMNPSCPRLRRVKVL